MSEPVTTEEAFYTVWMNGVMQERERIIALLEAWLNDDYGDFDATLALIKEEN